MTKLENCQDTKEKQRNKRDSHEDIKERQDTMTITLNIFTKEKQSDKRDGHEELRIRETGEWRVGGETRSPSHFSGLSQPWTVDPTVNESLNTKYE